ncbi:MAG: FecR domain-containing protein [Sphingomonas sp.]|uniref:FecR family protein n=1 Tax=Sphingomonas sp. TaxID=28214 RepID=UPI001B079F31|nr:FecR domain-containing protein [Sphingomonas sp.]MBO9622479.1 FecR domain-containing protein [Sphingomonas sp.]
MVSRRERSADAEAAAWVARLQSPSRTEATEGALRAWLCADPAHEDAFERANEIWSILPGAAASRGLSTPAARHAPKRDHRVLALAASILLLLSVGVAWWVQRAPDAYSTRVGEQTVATLDDGSRIALNTDTKVEVRYAPNVRRIRLDHGEAFFEVAHNRVRPFIVEAGNKQVRALGTSFSVRYAPEGVVVTLVTGKVSITDLRAGRRAEAIKPTVLTPGERLTAGPDHPATIDRPAIEAVTAWRRGQAVFSDTPLSAAVAEMNRYGGQHVAIEDPRLASLRVSGVFATNDTGEFAQAVAALHSLRVVQSGDQLRIVR